MDEGGEFAKNENCDLIIGVGGGSSLDSAKGIAVASTHEGSVWNYVASKWTL
ncbi:MAG: iron-containing alcohol dehydrogenase [Methanosarcinales archaeon]